MISSLRVINFKAFEDQTIAFRPLTLLAGLNGVGKSSVIQSLLLLRQSFDRGLLQNDSKLDLNGEFAKLGTGNDSKLDLNGEFVKLGTGMDILFEGANEDLIGFDLATMQGSATWRFSYNRNDDVLSEDESQVHPTIYGSRLFNDEFRYLQAERLGPRIFFQMSEYMVRQRKQIGAQGEYAAHFLSTFGSNEVLPELLHPDSEAETLKSQVEAWMNEISPGIRFNINDYPELGVVRLGMAFERASDIATRYFNAPNVGFGISYTLPILIAILSASENALVLLENPEAHLHPRGQSQLGNLLSRAADAGVQIVVETHSDHLLNGIRVAVRKRIIDADDVALHYFHRDFENDNTKGVQVATPEIDKHGKLSFWPDGFFDEYGKNLDELL